MRVNQYKRRKKVEELAFEDILIVARYFSYNYASRYLNVTLDPFRKYMQEKYPELHNQILQNGTIAKQHKNSKYIYQKVKCNAK